MRHVILASSLVCCVVAATGAAIEFPRVQHIEFREPLVIGQASAATLCDKYSRLFLEALHRSLECSEDYGPPPYKYEECEVNRRNLADYSRLRSYYCYGEEEL